MNPLETGPILIDQVYQRLVDAIADGSFPPGQRIRQSELADRLGVSRQPVSHALHLLKRQGLVQESGRKGLQVAPIDPVRLRQLYEVRGALDGLAARLAAGRVRSDAAGCAALRATLDAGRAITSATPVARLVALDEEFHGAIFRLSGNPILAEMVAPQSPHLRRSAAAVLAAPDYRIRAWTEHAAIAANVLAGDGDAAEQAARDHAVGAGRATEGRLSGAGSAAQQPHTQAA